MMLHRHFEREREKNLTTSETVPQTEVKPEPAKEEPKRKGRPPKGKD